MAEKQFVVFKLDNEEYGIDIMNVQEIGPYQETVKVPNVPKFIEGIINYRGSVIPIISLRKRFNMPVKEVDSDTRIIIINLNDKKIGFIVDEASQTIRLNEDNIDDTPEVISSIESKYIIGVGKLDKRLIILIDLEEILTDNEKKKIHNMDI